MAAYRRVYDSRRLQADCQEPGSRVCQPRLPLFLLVYQNVSLGDQSTAPWRAGVSCTRLVGFPLAIGEMKRAETARSQPGTSCVEPRDRDHAPSLHAR